MNIHASLVLQLAYRRQKSVTKTELSKTLFEPEEFETAGFAINVDGTHFENRAF